VRSPSRANEVDEPFGGGAEACLRLQMAYDPPHKREVNVKPLA